MVLWRCRTCGGVYPDSQPDGMRYFHACPPLVDAAGEPHERAEKRDENPAPGIVRVFQTIPGRGENQERIFVRGVPVEAAPIVAEGRGREPA